VVTGRKIGKKEKKARKLNRKEAEKYRKQEA
jgi:hypothetical protein